MRAAKDKWFQHKAFEAERGRHGGKLVWKCIHDIQRGRRGLVPTRSATVRDENERWRRHFSSILNIQSEFSVEELERVKLKPELAELLTEEELMGAIEKLKNGKAAGESGVLPEMVKVAYIGDEFPKKFLELVHDMWKEKNVPTEWRDAILIPIPKKGDLSHCDNWRGNSLLDAQER